MAPPSPSAVRLAALAHRTALQLDQGLGRRLFQAERFRGRVQRFGPLEEALDHPLQVLGLLQQSPRGFAVTGALQHLPPALDDRQAILQLMGHPGRHLAQVREALPQLATVFLDLGLSDILELHERADAIRSLDALEPPATAAGRAAPGWTGIPAQGFPQPGKGFQHKGRLQAHHARPNPQQIAPTLIQGRQAQPLVHPKHTRG